MPLTLKFTWRVRPGHHLHCAGLLGLRQLQLANCHLRVMLLLLRVLLLGSLQGSVALNPCTYERQSLHRCPGSSTFPMFELPADVRMSFIISISTTTKISFAFALTVAPSHSEVFQTWSFAQNNINKKFQLGTKSGPQQTLHKSVPNKDPTFQKQFHKQAHRFALVNVARFMCLQHVPGASSS